MLKKKFTAVLLSLFAMNVLCASDKVFEDQFSIKITEHFGRVQPPDIFSDFWRARTRINFDNGLYGYTRSSIWKYESQAQQAQQIANFAYSGNCNIIPDFKYISQVERYKFSILLERGYTTPIDLYVDKWHKFTGLPLVRSIKEEAETISHCPEKHQYRYTIELNNDTIWMTKIRNSPWPNVWKEDSRILQIGNSQNPCLINIDAVVKEVSSFIESSHYLSDIERVK